MDKVNPDILQAILVTLAAITFIITNIGRYLIAKKLADEPNPAPHDQFADAKICIQQHKDVSRRLTALEEHNKKQDAQITAQYKELRETVSKSSGAIHTRVDALATALGNLSGSLDTFMKMNGGKS